MLNAKPRTVRLAIGLATLFLATACWAPRYRANAEKSVTDAGRQTENSVGDPDLKKKLEIHNVRSRRARDQRLQVEFEIHNKMMYGVEFEWAVLWYDASNFRIEAPLDFVPAALGRNSSSTISILAPSPMATGWQLRVEKPRN